MTLREASGLLFKVKEKTSDRAPDITGECLLEGVTWRIAAWRHPGKDGKPGFLSLKFTRAEQQERGGDDRAF